MKNEISTKKIIQAATDCSHRAIERAVALGIAYSIRKDNKIVRIHPDGTEETLKECQPQIKYTGQKVIKF
ncbi:MAG: hypothetical protein KAG98_06725 [Lentisphaeria bacterium]|nr:hypothetical protein [Lentisphaeria bacterium]